VFISGILLTGDISANRIAVIVDIQKYREFELLVDNLINLREEDEDAILRESGILEKLVARAREEARSSGGQPKWEDEIDALQLTG
jgi:hypothetical protein